MPGVSEPSPSRTAGPRANHVVHVALPEHPPEVTVPVATVLLSLLRHLATGPALPDHTSSEGTTSS